MHRGTGSWLARPQACPKLIRGCLDASCMQPVEQMAASSCKSTEPDPMRPHAVKCMIAARPRTFTPAACAASSFCSCSGDRGAFGAGLGITGA